MLETILDTVQVDRDNLEDRDYLRIGQQDQYMDCGICGCYFDDREDNMEFRMLDSPLDSPLAPAFDQSDFGRMQSKPFGLDNGFGISHGNINDADFHDTYTLDRYNNLHGGHSTLRSGRYGNHLDHEDEDLYFPIKLIGDDWD